MIYLLALVPRKIKSSQDTRSPIAYVMACYAGEKHWYAYGMRLFKQKLLKKPVDTSR
jgi:hypothetical protein